MALQCKERQEVSKQKQRWTERADSIYEAYKGDACHCLCHLVLPCLTDKKIMKDDEVLHRVPTWYISWIYALWKPKICRITILGIAGGKALALGIRFELDWSKNPQNVYRVITRSSAASLHCLLLLCCSTWWRQLNLGNPRRYSFPGFIGLKYWPGL